MFYVMYQFLCNYLFFSKLIKFGCSFIQSSSILMLDQYASKQNWPVEFFFIFSTNFSQNLFIMVDIKIYGQMDGEKNLCCMHLFCAFFVNHAQKICISLLYSTVVL